VFLDQHARELYSNWAAECRDLVAHLRMVAGRNPNDPHLAALIGELSVKSPEFAALWSAHPVRDKTHGSRDFHHPLVGQLSLSFEALPVPGSEDQRMIVYYVAPGSPSADALGLLSRFAQRIEARPAASADVDDLPALI
jgi:hypothetical protein